MHRTALHTHITSLSTPYYILYLSMVVLPTYLLYYYYILILGESLYLAAGSL